MEKLRPIEIFKTVVEIYPKLGLKGKLMVRKSIEMGPLCQKDELVYLLECGECYSFLRDGDLYIAEESNDYMQKIIKWLHDLAEKHNCSKSLTIDYEDDDDS